MRYILIKSGAQCKVFAQVQNGEVFWKASRKNATEMNLTQARKLARSERAEVYTRLGSPVKEQ